jgi:malate dehydrogenase (oxaloacetate-decarboxylating)(NADP+)
MMTRRNAHGMMMVRLGDADGLVSGLTMSFPETIRPALQIVGRAPGVEHVAGMYMMVLKSGEVKFFADATVNIDPDAETLAEIAIQVAEAVREFDIVPRVAMISFSNFGSAPHVQSDKVSRAVAIVRRRHPNIEIDGELQADTAVSFEQLKEHYPFTSLTDAANVLVFPDLASGNVAYKIMSSLGGATAVGPILLGVGKPVTVLPRNAPVSTIVDMTAYTVCRAQGGFPRRDRAARPE